MSNIEYMCETLEGRAMAQPLNHWSYIVLHSAHITYMELLLIWSYTSLTCIQKDIMHRNTRS